MGAVQITKGQMVQQARTELESVEKQLAVTSHGLVLLQEAQTTLRSEEFQSPVEKALDLLIGSQLGHAHLNKEQLEARKRQIETFLEQANSAIVRPSLIPPA